MLWVKILTGVAITAGTAAVLFAALSAVMYFIVFFSPKKGQNVDLSIPDGANYKRYGDVPKNMIIEAASVPFESVETTSRDGTRLTGRLYVNHPQDAPLAICFHGYRGTPCRDFSGGLKSLIEAGNNVLLVNQRAHGTGGGHTITFGIKERLDCVDWVKYCTGRFGPDVKIVLFGISMGATTVLMACAEDLPDSVRWVVADCPFNAPKDIIKSVAAGMGLPAAALYVPIYCGARVFGRFDPDEVTAADGVRKSRVPVTVIHGEADSYVPCRMSEPFPELNPLCERFVFPHAEHGVSFLEDKERYERIVADICAKVRNGHA
ncbi:MAG: hypothetical protein J5912_08100 [Clostridia bacterium]|nr:hypothetical protein [Clostridia bacterium]